MSLQGSLDTFALPDVLVLLAGTRKTGELGVTGSRSAETTSDDFEARVWFEAGRMAGHDVPGAETAVDAVFSLLRLRRGEFSFTAAEAGSAAWGGGADPLEIEPVLAEAQARLEEWIDIESVVSSSAAWLRLVGEAPRPKVTVTAAQWRLVATIGSGRPVGAVVSELGQGELDGFRAVKGLVEAGLVAVDPESAAAPVPEPAPAAAVAEVTEVARVVDVPEAASWPEPAPIESLQWSAPISSWGATSLEEPPPWATNLPDLVDGSGAAGWAADRDPEPSYGNLRVVPDPEPVVEPQPEGFESADDGGFGVASGTADMPAWRAEVAGLEDLDSFAAHSPLSAPAAEPDTMAGAEPAGAVPEGDDGAVVAGEDGEEPLNRGLLLKFLSSVRN